MKKKPTKKSAKSKKKPAAKKLAVKPKRPIAKAAKAKKKGAPRKALTRRLASRPTGTQSVETVSLDSLAKKRSRTAKGGDFQGVSTVESVSTESADELLEEGQTLEAEFVSGVEDALDPDQSEVTTREVPEDDVPEEYEENDRP
jgi:hypothetical protein